MPERIKTGIIGSAFGAAIAFATILIGTGSYKKQVETNTKNIDRNSITLINHESRLTGEEHDADSRDKMLAEMRGDIKTLLSRTE